MEQLKAFMEKAKTDGELVEKLAELELSEADLDSVSGGWTKDRYDEGPCKAVGKPVNSNGYTTIEGLRCTGGNFIPCDHYSSTRYDNDTRLRVRCAMNVFPEYSTNYTPPNTN